MSGGRPFLLERVFGAGRVLMCAVPARVAGVPEIVVNGKYRVGRMGPGGLAEMLPVLEFLVQEGRALDKSVAERIQVNLVDIGVVVSVVQGRAMESEQVELAALEAE